MISTEIEEAVAEAGLQPLPTQTAEKFAAYLDLLLKWNARLNLTAIREPEEILQRHFIECIFAAQQLPVGIQTLLDFGSGGGFPGLPIALCHPEIAVTLGESQAKKAAFLRETIRTLALGNTTVYQGRIEALPQQFEAVTLRAVDKMQEACRAAIQNVSHGGYFVLLTTAEMKPSFSTDFPQIRWNDSIPLPHSTQRVLLIGQKF